jgi:hypothetical protein
VALNGFSELAAALEVVDASPMARMRAYLEFAAAHPGVYQAMFSTPSGLAFAADDTPEPLHHAFSGLRDAFPDVDGTRAEVAWAALHGLATLQASGRLSETVRAWNCLCSSRSSTAGTRRARLAGARPHRRAATADVPGGRPRTAIRRLYVRLLRRSARRQVARALHRRARD